MMGWKRLQLIAFRFPAMAPPLPAKVLINHASRWAAMGPSSQGNELIYYQPPSVGGRPGFWEKNRGSRHQSPGYIQFGESLWKCFGFRPFAGP